VGSGAQRLLEVSGGQRGGERGVLFIKSDILRQSLGCERMLMTTLWEYLRSARRTAGVGHFGGSNLHCAPASR
jgi:hypothetical protein